MAQVVLYSSLAPDPTRTGFVTPMIYCNNRQHMAASLDAKLHLHAGEPLTTDGPEIAGTSSRLAVQTLFPRAECMRITLQCDIQQSLRHGVPP